MFRILYIKRLLLDYYSNRKSDDMYLISGCINRMKCSKIKDRYLVKLRKVLGGLCGIKIIIDFID